MLKYKSKYKNIAGDPVSSEGPSPERNPMWHPSDEGSNSPEKGFDVYIERQKKRRYESEFRRTANWEKKMAQILIARPALRSTAELMNWGRYTRTHVNSNLYNEWEKCDENTTRRKDRFRYFLYGNNKALIIQALLNQWILPSFCRQYRFCSLSGEQTFEAGLLERWL